MLPSVTVLTLVDSTEHLTQTRDSLQRQGQRSWQWLVVPLGDGIVAPDFADDDRIQILCPPRFIVAQGVAACRHHGFEVATSSHVLELDQHDFLSPDAVAKVTSALKSTGADLLYPDFAPVPIDDPITGYSPEFGWETYRAVGPDETLRAVRAFDPEPSALSLPDYAPSHALVWNRELFLALGGVDPTLGTADTFDLVCRAYLSGASFHHLSKCLVFSRMDAYRYRDRDREAEISATHMHVLVAEWSRRNDLAMLDLGAADNPAPGFTSVDLHDADITCDIREGLPLDDGTVGCIRAVDFLEHMNHCPDSACLHGADGGPRCVVGMMNELYRVLAPGGWLMSRTPSTDGRGAFQDPTHTSFWNLNSFSYYTRAEHAQFLTGVHCRFQAARLAQVFPSEWHVENNVPFVDADLVALKGQRQPGICEI